MLFPCFTHLKHALDNLRQGFCLTVFEKSPHENIGNCWGFDHKLAPRLGELTSMSEKFLISQDQNAKFKGVFPP